MNSNQYKKRKSHYAITILILLLVGMNVCFLIMFYPEIQKDFLANDAPEKIKERILDDVENKLVTEIPQKIHAAIDEKIKNEITKSLRDVHQKSHDSPEEDAPLIRLKKASKTVVDIQQLSNGIPLRTEVVYGTGQSVSEERISADSYTANYQVKIRIPQPAIKMSDLEKNGSRLSLILPRFASLFAKGAISPYFRTVYDAKIAEVKQNATRLNQIISKASLYECNTILNFVSDQGRRMLFIQADMDAEIKGSDGDRLPKMPPEQVNSLVYNPFTAYHWRVSGDFPNPMIEGWKRRITIGEKELAATTTDLQKKQWIQNRIATLKQGVEHMRRNGFLISTHDPYIVLPSHLVNRPNDAFSPKIGDYAVVIHGNKVYPCIVGDESHDSSIGEASARIATELNAQWKLGSKAVSSPTVNYIIFPNSRETQAKSPDYALWRAKCIALLSEIGGLGREYQLHEWEQPLKSQTKSSAR